MFENMSRVSRTRMGAVTDGIKVHIEKHAWNKMHGWCKAAESEVSGVGLCTVKGSIFTVYDVFFPKQYCSGSYTEIDDAALLKLNYHVHKNKKNVEDIKFWWHTHYNFNTFWSGTDDNTAQTMMKANGEWQLSVVINQAGDWLARADFMEPFNMTVDNLPIFLINNSRKRKRKRNFKTDIKKWVYPLSARPVPEGKDPEMILDVESIASVGHDSAGWLSEWRKGYKDNEKKHEGKKSYEFQYHRGWELDPSTGKWVNHDKAPARPYEPISTKYVHHNGQLMTIEERDKLVEKASFCMCNHTTDWEQCVCTADCDICTEKICKEEYKKAAEEATGRAEDDKGYCLCMKELDWTDCKCEATCYYCRSYE